MDTLTAFQVLEISPDSSLEEIQKAYLEKVSIYHPEEYPTEFAKIQTAYRTLCRFKKKAEYTEKKEEIVPEVEPISKNIDDDYLGQQALFLKLQEESKKREQEETTRAEEYNRLLYLVSRGACGYSIASEFTEKEIIYLIEKYPLSKKQYKQILAQYRKEHLGKKTNKEIKKVIAVLDQKVGIRPPKWKEIVLVSVLLFVVSLLLGNLNIEGLSDENYIWAFYCIILFYVFRTMLTPLVSATISLSVLWSYVLFFMYGEDGSHWGLSLVLVLVLTVALAVVISMLVLRIRKEREDDQPVVHLKKKWVRKVLEWTVIIGCVMLFWFVNFSDTIFNSDTKYDSKTDGAIGELNVEEFQDLMDDLEGLVPFLNESQQMLDKYKFDVSFYGFGEKVEILAEEDQVEQIKCDEELLHNMKNILNNPRISSVHWWKEENENSYYLVVDLEAITPDCISEIRYGDEEPYNAEVHLGDNWYYCEW